MTTRAHIADLLRGQDQVSCIDKKTFEVQLKTPVLLKLKKEGVDVGGKRIIDYAGSLSYLKGLLGMKAEAGKWDRNTHRRNVTALAKLYDYRVIPNSKKDTSFQIDEGQPSEVRVTNTGEVIITWGGDGSVNTYQYEDAVKHLSDRDWETR